jgi:undecaprenyl pyrophosphate phosphatase UppP
MSAATMLENYIILAVAIGPLEIIKDVWKWIDNTITLPAIGILFVATFLGLWQWFDRRARERDLSDVDRAHFRKQDLRRWFGVGVMVALAAAMAVVMRQRMPTSWMIGTLTVMILLIVVLLVLAFADLMATRRYARRHRRALAEEHTRFMLEVIRRASSSNAIAAPPKKQSEAPDV